MSTETKTRIFDTNKKNFKFLKEYPLPIGLKVRHSAAEHWAVQCRDNRITNDYNYDLKRIIDMVLHVFELIHATFGVALTDFAEGLVLVPALADVLPVDLVHGGLLGLIARLGQIFLQGLEKTRT